MAEQEYGIDVQIDPDTNSLGLMVTLPNGEAVFYELTIDLALKLVGGLTGAARALSDLPTEAFRHQLFSNISSGERTAAEFKRTGQIPAGVSRFKLN